MADVPVPVGRVVAKRAGGFSLIEIIVAIALLSLLAGAMAPVALQQVTARRIASTRATLDALVEGMVGAPGSDAFGYVGDMGSLPPTLEDLNSAVGKPPYAFGAPGVGFGYAGPYAPRVRAGTSNFFVDAWDVRLQYNGTAQVRSAGPDRNFGNADDLVAPPAPAATTGNLVVRVLGAPNTGDPAQTLAASEADVFVSRANAGNFQEIPLVEPVGGPGPWTLAGLHIGHHGLRAVGTGAYGGAGTVRDFVTVRGGTATVTLTLEQP